MTTYVDHRFVDLFGLEITAGRFFSPEIPTDATSAVVINEKAARELGLTDPVGRRFYKEFGGAKEGEFVTIIGVLKDFHFSSLHHEILPMLLRPLSPENWSLTSVKIRGERLPQTLALIEKAWKKFRGGQPFKYSFLDQDFDALYDSERRAGILFTVLSALAVLVACLGLYGLVSFAAERRMREIGIRKTFGASVGSLVGLLSREVLVLVGVASVVASLPAFTLASGWLRNFAYRISIRPLMFVTTAGAILAVAVLSVAFRALRAAAANPVDTLRCE
jgi:putative ABC transport system permease protein